MKLHVDLETLRLIEGPGFRNPVDAIRFKRGDGATLEVVFLANGQTPVHLGEAVALKFGVKPRSRYDLGYIVFTDEWIQPGAEETNPAYQCSPSFNTEELNSALNVGSPTASELAEIILMGEISWTVGDGEPTSTRTFQVIVENDVNRGTEGVPVAADPPYPSPLAIALLNQVVRHDIPQDLDPQQQQRARANIGIGEGVNVCEFASDTDKRNATGLSPGTLAVITDEGSRIEQFLGEFVPADPDLQLVTIGSERFFITRNSETVFVAVDGGGANAVFYTNSGSWAAQGAWIPGGVQQATGAAGSPALADWSATSIDVVAFAGPESVQANWNVLRNTVYLLVNNYRSEAITVNGVTITDGSYVGWVDPAQVPVESASGLSVSEISSYAEGEADDYTLLYLPSIVLSVNGGTGLLPLPIQTCPRGRVHLSVT